MRGLTPIQCATALAGLLVLSAPALATAEPLRSWIEGHWADPRVHRCGEIHIRIEIDEARYRVFQETYGRSVQASGGPVLGVGEGLIRVYNEGMSREQQIRYVAPYAHVLERADGFGGVTFVRCPDPAVPAETG
ncbi:MAG: hypothetical protein AAGI34_17330 [Pseudomonadota bacterium]